MHILSCYGEGAVITEPAPLVMPTRERNSIVSQALKMLEGIKEYNLKGTPYESFYPYKPHSGSFYMSPQINTCGIYTLDHYSVFMIEMVGNVMDTYLSKVSAYTNQSATLDYGDDTLVMYLENHPNMIYKFVYDILRTSSLQDGITKLSDIAYKISKSSESDNVIDIISRYQIYANKSFWEKILKLRYISNFCENPPDVDFDLLRKELSMVGLYGFSNPYEDMKKYYDNSLCVKTKVTLPEFAIEFLHDTILSGGGSID